MEIQITYRKTSRLSMRIVKNGDIHVSAPFYASRKTVQKFIDDNREWIEKARKRQQEREETKQGFYERLPLETKQNRIDAVQRLNGIIAPIIERHAREMGVMPGEICYRATKSKWGSCNCKTRKICFSLYLLLLPEWCIEHVVVHELAHLIVPNHSKEFYDVMDKHFPLWREARAETKRLVCK
ncbi:MAG: DUF45 domain-containing protein [Prevotella sp.]|nr:DUF45 domain-containing protein [Prevotella sp.]